MRVLQLLDSCNAIYSAHNNKWDFEEVRVSLNLSARVAKSSIYFCEKVSIASK